MIGDSNQASLATVRLALLLSCPVYSGEKEKANRAYCSSTSWPNSIFPNSSMELRVPKICQKYKADQDTILGKTQIRPHHSIVKQTSSLSFFSTNTLFTLFFLVLAGPTNDISNLRHLSVGEKNLWQKDHLLRQWISQKELCQSLDWVRSSFWRDPDDATLMNWKNCHK